MKTNRTHAASSQLKLGASVVALLTVFGTGAAYAQAAGEQMETVVVTGFRASLEKALDMKRNALDSSDSILAEDITKFPDLNLSESIQRIPGVALARDEGEGRQIQVRGLSSQFTRVRINGLEALTTVGSEDSQGGTNRTRAFDFNVFASDLFKGITVHKSSSADLEEGSLGATVDLRTARPFDFNSFTLALSAQGGYADLNGAINPRASALISDTFMGGKLGVLFSVAAGVRNTLQVGSDTTRYANDGTAQPPGHGEPLIAGCVSVPNAATNCGSSSRFASVAYNGTPLAGTAATQTSVAASGGLPIRQTAGAISGTTYNATALPNNYDVVNEAFDARFPRYDYIPNHEKRFGGTLSVQWQPDDSTLVSLDLMAADFSVVRQEEYLEANSLSVTGAGSNGGSSFIVVGTPNVAQPLLANTLGRGNVNILSYTLDSTLNNMNQFTATGVGLRAEHRLDHLDTRFTQGTLEASHTFSEDFKAHAVLGHSESHHRNPIQTTLAMDYDCTAATAGGNTANCGDGQAGGAGSIAHPFTLDYTQSGKTPVINFGNVDPLSTNGWFLSLIRERAFTEFNTFNSFTGDFEWNPRSSIKIQGGVDIRGYIHQETGTARSNGANTNIEQYIPLAIENTPLSSYTQTVTMRGLSLPTGVPAQYTVVDLNKANALFHIWDQTVDPTVLTTSQGACKTAPGCGAFQQGYANFGGNNGTVRENDYGGWLQAGWDTELAGMSFRGNAGGRFVLTETDSSGLSYMTTGTQANTFVTTEVKTTYHDFLPSVNAILSPVDDLLIRFNASYVLTRPNLTSIIPGVTIAQSSASNPVTVTSGNPHLQPFRAKTLDLSFEWYYGKGAMLSVAGFWKHLDNIAVSLNLSGPFNTNPLGIPVSTLLSFCNGAYSGHCDPTDPGTTYVTTVSQKGAPLYGTEIDWQQPFSFLPNPFDNFGVIANYTYVQGQQNYYLNPANPTQVTVADLNGLSRTTYNATLYYDDTVFEARVSAAFRSKFLLAVGPTSGLSWNDAQVQQASLNVDASTSYKFGENITVDLQALNIFDQGLVQYNDTIGHRPLAYYKSGREFFAGLRYNY